MEAILSTFGIDWRLLLINAVNFGVLLLALWYFLYGPVRNMLEERRQRVIKGVQDAEAAARARKELEASRAGVLAEAGKEADTLLAEARAAGAHKEQELRDAGARRAEAALKEAKAEALAMKAQALEESKKEVAKLIVLGVEKASH